MSGYSHKDVTDWDSNNGESSQMLLKKTQIKTCSCKTSGVVGEFEYFSVHLNFYELFPFFWVIFTVKGTASSLPNKFGLLIAQKDRYHPLFIVVIRHKDFFSEFQ